MVQLEIFDKSFIIMNYENFFTRANPGLVVILIDQSKSMEDPWSGGKTLAEQTALSINRCLSEMALWFTSGTFIKNSANIVLIGYGGVKDSMAATLLHSGSIVSLFEDDSIPVLHLKQKISDGAGGIIEIDTDLKEFVKPTAVWGTPMASAFELAKSIIQEWVSRPLDSVDEDGKPIVRDASKDPVPIVVNISDGEPTDSEADVRKFAKDILDTTCPDGNPLIFNIHLSANGGKEVSMPTDDTDLPDAMSKLLYDISSRLPQSMVFAAQQMGFPHAVEGAKTFLSNVTEVEKFVNFLNFGTQGTKDPTLR